MSAIQQMFAGYKAAAATTGTEVMLLQGEGADNSTTILDSGVNAYSVAVFGNARIRTNIFKNGSGSLFFDGSGDYLTVGPAAIPEPLQLSGADHTIEAWIYPTVNTGYRRIFTQQQQPSVNNLFLLRLDAGPKLTAAKYTTTGTLSYVVTSTNNVTLNGWSHIAFTMQGTTARVFINGNLEGTATATGTLGNMTTYGTFIGVVGGSSFIEYFQGYIDDLRVTKGLAKYTANFTPT